MVRASTVALGAAGALLAAAGAAQAYQRYATETVPYTVVARLDGAELRRYPPLVLAETVAPTERAAFRRLFEYIGGANDGGAAVRMTAPVESDGRASLPMTAPVETGSDAGGTRMAFYLPAEYDPTSAPRPTDDAVDLVALPERTLAIRRFSWRPTERRVARETDRLLEVLAAAGVEVVGEPTLLGYDAPWTLPFLRRNEVAVRVDSGT